jgi:hypothetical protein
MEIISHRGLWLNATEKNTPAAFTRAFSAGFGVETDIRDLSGQLVISHDMPTGGEMALDSFFELYATHSSSATLALNIKADGLQQGLRKSIDRFGIKNYFLFDLSVPNLLQATRSGLHCYSRESEHERPPLSLYSECGGVWMDCFDSDWIDESAIENHLAAGKKVCVVSPELHQRPHLQSWKKYRSTALRAGRQLMLCTDFPNEAKEFFGG